MIGEVSDRWSQITSPLAVEVGPSHSVRGFPLGIIVVIGGASAAGFALVRFDQFAVDVDPDQRAIGPDYVQLIPEVVAMFEWAHMLHRQLYDVLSDARISDERQVRVQQLLAYYRSRPDLALSLRPKGMSLMEGQPYSLTFRRAAPRTMSRCRCVSSARFCARCWHAADGSTA